MSTRLAEVKGIKDFYRKAEMFPHGHLRREWRTVAAMIHCYCQGHHGSAAAGEKLCHACEQLLDYSTARLQGCRFGEDKPTCAKCPVHCYQRERREQIKVVMRYAGPRMLYLHPVMTVLHWIDGVRSTIRNPKRRKKAGGHNDVKTTNAVPLAPPGT